MIESEIRLAMLLFSVRKSGLISRNILGGLLISMAKRMYDAPNRLPTGAGTGKKCGARTGQLARRAVLKKARSRLENPFPITRLTHSTYQDLAAKGRPVNSAGKDLPSSVLQGCIALFLADS
jgi:hypothetical protein